VVSELHYKDRGLRVRAIKVVGFRIGDDAMNSIIVCLLFNPKQKVASIMVSFSILVSDQPITDLRTLKRTLISQNDPPYIYLYGLYGLHGMLLMMIMMVMVMTVMV